MPAAAPAGVPGAVPAGSLSVCPTQLVYATMLPLTVVRRLAATCTVACVALSSPGVAQRGTPTNPAGTRAPTADSGLAMGSFVSSRIDDKKLPVKDLVTDDRGTQYLIEFDELVLSLKGNGEFRAALRYRQTLARKGEQTTQEPIERMTVYGTWVREGAAIRFVPDPTRGGEGLRILAGTHTAKTITVPFDYQNGRVLRRARVLLLFDPGIF